MVDRTYLQDFKYTHRNPYHEKLQEFEGIVFRDEEGELYRGSWNDKVFKRSAPLVVEVGTGYGHFMMDYCQNNPEVNFVGMDYRFKRSFNLAKKLSKIEKPAFKYLRAKGERIHYQFAESEVDEVFYFFPDPWPKERHHKKRTFQQPFIEAVYKVLRPGGKFFIKTDHEAYAHWMDEVIEKQDLFHVELKSFDLREEHPEHFLSSFATKFEKIFLSQKIPIKAFVLTSKKED